MARRAMRALRIDVSRGGVEVVISYDTGGIELTT
jgi:hypothetical protein